MGSFNSSCWMLTHTAFYSITSYHNSLSAPSLPNPVDFKQFLHFCCWGSDSSCTRHASSTFLGSPPLSFPYLSRCPALLQTSRLELTLRVTLPLLLQQGRGTNKAGTVTLVIKECMFSVKCLRGEWTRRERRDRRKEDRSVAERKIKNSQFHSAFHGWERVLEKVKRLRVLK